MLMFLRLVRWLEARRFEGKRAVELGVGGMAGWKSGRWRGGMGGGRGVVSFPRRGAVKPDVGRSLPKDG